MNELSSPNAQGLDAYGVLTDPTTLTIQRFLPGPIERIWAYLTDDRLRRQWLAAGVMELKAGAPFEFVWRNDELTDPPGQRPAHMPPEHRMECRILSLDPPRELTITFGRASEVTFLLEARGQRVLLTLHHRRAPDREVLLNVAAGWHAHLDVLVARASGTQPAPHWDHWSRLREDYDRRLPA